MGIKLCGNFDFTKISSLPFSDSFVRLFCSKDWCLVDVDIDRTFVLYHFSTALNEEWKYVSKIYRWSNFHRQSDRQQQENDQRYRNLLKEKFLVGDGWWRPNVLVTSLTCSRPIKYIEKITNITKKSRQHNVSATNIRNQSPSYSHQHTVVNNITFTLKI